MMLFNVVVACLMGVTVCEIFDAELFRFALLARTFRSIPSRRQRNRFLPPRLPGRLPPGLIAASMVGPQRMITDDPADISNMLDGHCGGGNPGSLVHMFQDMFVSNSQADAMVQEAQWNLRNSGNKYSWANSFIETERMSKTIGRLNPGTGNSNPGSGNSNPGSGNSNPGSGNSNPGSGISNPGSGNTNPGSGNSNPGSGNTNPGSGNSNPGKGNSNTGGGNSIPGGGSCCETEMRITAPFTVLERGKRMQVVHMNSSYQFVHEGICVTPRARCRSHGVCVQVYRYEYMLLYDPDLIYTHPPVRFGRVQVKSHCECMNIGV